MYSDGAVRCAGVSMISGCGVLISPNHRLMIQVLLAPSEQMDCQVEDSRMAVAKEDALLASKRI